MSGCLGLGGWGQMGAHCKGCEILTFFLKLIVVMVVHLCEFIKSFKSHTLKGLIYGM